MTQDPLTVHLLIEGRVQGVGYRAWCAEEAVARDLAGWARNLKNGAVEAVISGPSDTVVDMMDALWRGPALARVTSVSDLEPVEPATGRFTVRETV
ncbi:MULTISPECIES: acylphosphatase [unclassified Roseibium]|uniref:acylphosphatase n=1 Tax=unclassified Roseibium TaxID=2629323 RepID=UPI0009281CF1|nr:MULTISPECIES: acylphosphatase [unclassified Roseibium]OJJ11468.1 acylphosphatase [Alphaproteobacteria bacterium AO1-B]